MTRMKKRSSIQHSLLEPFEVQINHRSDVQSNELRCNQASDYHQTQRPSRGSVSTVPQRNRHSSDNSRNSRHYDRSKTVHTCIVNRLLRRLTRIHALSREVDDQNSVLLYDPHQHEQADERIQRSLLAEDV